MSRILDYIAKYDQTLTISQLKKFIELEEMQVKEKETKDNGNLVINGIVYR